MRTGLLLLLAVVASMILAIPAHAAEKPNIIFILADDLGYGDLGCYGQEKIQTPNLDRMAKEGVRFTQAYAGSTVCAPSRSVLMTGQHGGHTRVRSNAVKPLRPEDVTPAELVKSQGYRTAMIGKWGLGEEGNTGVPNLQGFDYFFGYHDHGHAHNHYPSWLWRNQEKVNIEGNDEIARNVCGKCGTYADDLFAEEAVKFITEPTDTPYFLYLSFVVPHANNERYAYDGNGMEVPELGLYADEDWPAQQKGQAAMVTRMDSHIGRILQQLRDSGADKNTVVFFSSDNGPLHEGGGVSDFFKSSGPLQGHKRSLHDGGIRVPFLAWGPGLIPGGRESDHVCAFWDVLPTVAELSGASIPADIDGISLWPTLSGVDGQRAHEYLYWEFHERGFEQAIRQENWKAIRENLGDVELYDLSTDIHEDRDIAAEHPDVTARMLSLFEGARTESADFPIRARKRDK